jgi:hypothetical protein
MELDSQAVIAQLNASPVDRIAALRLLKNDVIGDVQKKKLWVRYGLIPHIVRILLSNASETTANGKGTREPFLALKTFTNDKTASLQALQLLASFSNGRHSVSFSCQRTAVG